MQLSPKCIFLLQKLFIIFAFNETLIAGAVSHIHRIPWIGQKLEAPFKEFLAKQKDKLHRKSEAASGNVSIYRSICFGYIVAFFVDDITIQIV